MHRFGLCFRHLLRDQTDARFCRYALSLMGRYFCFQFSVCLSRSEFGAPCVRGVHSSNTHCVAVYRPISTRFAAFFFGMDCTFRDATQFSHSSLGGATISAKLRSKIAKSPKIGGKVCAHHFVAEGFEKKVHRHGLGLGLQMCIYIKKFRTSLPSADSNCQSS